jgi:murein DD-endopeptidase MepM/ murein hydrolase activator NlpD
MLFPDQANAATEPSVTAPTPVMHPSTDSGHSAASATESWQPTLLRDVSEMNRNSGFPNQVTADDKQADKALEEHLVESASEPSELTVSPELLPQTATEPYSTLQPDPNPGSATIEISRPSSALVGSEVAYPTPQTVYVQPKTDQTKFSGASNLPGTVVIASDLSAPPISVVYNVTPGDTLAQIANRHQISVEALIQTNRLNDPNHIEINQRLKIPHQSMTRQGSKLEDSKFGDSQALTGLPAMERQFPRASALGKSSGSSSLFNRTVTPSVIPSEVKSPFVPKPLTVPLGSSVLSQMAAETGDRGEVALSALALGQFQKKDAAPKPLVIPLPSAPLLSDERQSGKSKAIASIQREELTLSDSKDFSALDTKNSTKVYTDRLRAEVNRLRAEYQAQTSYQLVNASWEPEAEATEAQTPTMVQLADRLRRTNPEFAPQTEAQTNPPASQQLAQVEPQASELIVEQLQDASESRDEIVATAPLSSSAYDPLKNPAIGRIVSPELPPLLGPDAYLPGGNMQFKGYIWPSQGILTSGYGWRWGRMHRGIDIAGPIGTPIVAAAPGVVSFAGWNSGGYGNLVEIEHPDGSLTLYAHNNRILVNKGQKVTQGQQISEMGSTGRSTGPHLHFEIHPSGSGAVNPMALLPQERSNLSQY